MKIKFFCITALLFLFEVQPSFSAEKYFTPEKIVCQKSSINWPYQGANQVLIERNRDRITVSQFDNKVINSSNQWSYKLISFTEDKGFQAFGTIGEAGFNIGTLLIVTWAKNNDVWDRQNEIFGHLTVSTVGFGMKTKNIEEKVKVSSSVFSCQEY